MLDIPMINDIACIEIYGDYLNDVTNYQVLEDEAMTQIYEGLISGKKTHAIQSVNDIPPYRELVKIDLVDYNDTVTSWFVYQADDGKYYIENPYVVVYEISDETYEMLTQ